MTKKDYVLIAEALHSAKANFEVVRAVADVLKRDNARFEYYKFMSAAKSRLIAELCHNNKDRD